MQKCNCSMSISILGDGCHVCNPSFWQELHDEVRYFYRETLSDDLRDNFILIYDDYEDWLMIAEYFTHE